MEVKNVVPHSEIRRALFSWYREKCAFLLGYKRRNEFIVAAIMPTPNVTSRDPAHAYAISTSAWKRARSEARKVGMSVIGHAHSHPNGPPWPSPLDIAYIRLGELGLVYHPRGYLVWYTSAGVICTQRERQNVVQRLIGLLFTDS